MPGGSRPLRSWFAEGLRHSLRSWAGGLAELVWPSGQACGLCGRGPPAPALAPASVCLACAAEAFAFQGHPCRICGRPVPSAGPGPVCDECTSARRQANAGLRPAPATGYCRAVSLGLYRGQLAEWVKQLKYLGRPWLARPLGQLLALAVAGVLGPGPQGRSPGSRPGRPQPWAPLVVPVPLHRTRLRERGYNQAALIAGSLAETLGYAYLGEALVRTAAAPPQAALGRRGRLGNLRGVIEPGPEARGAGVLGRDVLLVDDVLTTGATLQACSEALLGAGAGRVFGCVVAAGVPARLWEGGGGDPGQTASSAAAG